MEHVYLNTYLQWSQFYPKMLLMTSWRQMYKMYFISTFNLQWLKTNLHHSFNWADEAPVQISLYYWRQLSTHCSQSIKNTQSMWHFAVLKHYFYYFHFSRMSPFNSIHTVNCPPPKLQYILCCVSVFILFLSKLTAENGVTWN